MASARAVSSKRKLCELMSDMNIGDQRKCKPKSNQRSVGCQTEMNEQDTKIYSKAEMNDIIKETKRELISKYNHFMKSTNVAEKIIHSHKYEF